MCGYVESELDSPRIIFLKIWEQGVVICEELGMQVCNWTEGSSTHKKKLKLKKSLNQSQGSLEPGLDVQA
jgi:hypothetical protein